MQSWVAHDVAWLPCLVGFPQNFRVPREVVWLNGAPGSGKGVSTPHILRARNMSRSVCMSTLLVSVSAACTLHSYVCAMPECVMFLRGA